MNSGQIGRTRPISFDSGPNFLELGPILAGLGPNLADFDKVWVDFGRRLAEFDPFGKLLVDSGPCVWSFLPSSRLIAGQFLPSLALCFRPILVDSEILPEIRGPQFAYPGPLLFDHRRSLVEIGRFRPKTGRSRSKSSRFCAMANLARIFAILGQMAQCGQIRSTLGVPAGIVPISAKLGLPEFVSTPCVAQ